MLEITYTVYILLSSSIVLWVGEVCYKNGQVYILNYFPNRINFGNGINNLLRIAYYLLNIGLVIWSLNTMNEITKSVDLIKEITRRLSYMIIIIGSLHFINIYTVYLIHKHFKNQ